MSQLIQTKLHRLTNGVVRERVCFLPVDPRVKAGSVITLKDDPQGARWTVVEQYMKQDQADIQRGWDNQLPKSQRTER